MKKLGLSLVFSAVVFSMASVASAQTAVLVAPATVAAPVADGPRFRFGVELGGGVGVVTVFAPYANVAGKNYTLSLRLGAQLNNHWALMAQLGAGVTDGVVGVPNALLAEYSPNRYFGVGFGPSLSVLMTRNGGVTGAGGMVRLTGYLGSSAPSRRHSFLYGIETNVSFLGAGLFSTATITLGYEMH